MDFTESAEPSANEDEARAFAEIPLTGLSKRTRLQLSNLLNIKKLLRSEEGYERDWRGIATLCQQKALCDESSISGQDPMGKVLQYWCTNNAKTATFEHLERFLGIIDRWDVCDDIYENIVEDAENYRNQLHHKSSALDQQSSMVNNCDTTDGFGLGSDSNILTKDDVLRAQKGLPPQKYDAFVLFADADINYAVEMLSKLEDHPDYNFKLCLKDRDLLGGVSFAHVALTQLIEERCKHLIVILTEEFLKSPENKFLVNYAQALQIQHKTRKIIPLLYEETVSIPRTLKIYTHLKYNANVSSLYDFWAKLASSIRNVHMIPKSPSSYSKVDHIAVNSNKTPQKHKQQQQQQTQQHQQQQLMDNLPTPPMDIPSININGHALSIDEDEIPKKKDRIKFKKRSSLRHTEKKQLLSSDGLLLRNAHSTSQLNTCSTVFYDTNLSSMTDLCSSEGKKKIKWPSKLFKKVFSRSSNRLQEA